uniref:Uncharacterized protein n=1 Tax=Oncorhynchus kisutch TaxID=8019 RepID=A0A8C7DPP3_ONCKI
TQCYTGQHCSILTIQHSTIQHSTIQDKTAQHSTIQDNTAQHSTIQDNTDKTAQHSTIQDNTAQHSTRQDNTAQHSTRQDNTAQHIKSFMKMIMTSVKLFLKKMLKYNVNDLELYLFTIFRACFMSKSVNVGDGRGATLALTLLHVGGSEGLGTVTGGLACVGETLHCPLLLAQPTLR